MFIADKLLTMLILPTALMTECALIGLLLSGCPLCSMRPFDVVWTTRGPAILASAAVTGGDDHGQPEKNR
jgi:hypothetical protein